jgi:beta-mannosidase
LHEGWTLTPGPDADVPAAVMAGPVRATVPGCVHTDLLAAGLIPDPYEGENETGLGWIGEADWVYRTAFDWADDDGGATESSTVDLVCEGLDTVATVTLNGVELGRTANMHRGYRFPVRSALRSGSNELAVAFESPLRYARRQRDEFPGRPHGYVHPYNQIRKMACNFGWDWGPTLVTSGIWRPIGLASWSHARLAQVRPEVSADGAVEVRADLAWAGPPGEPVVLTATVGQATARVTVAPGAAKTAVAVNVANPALWWPRGYGAQPLYDLEVTLSTVDGTELDRWRRRIGFRSVRLDAAADALGSEYTLVVNGRPLFVRGVNWIPDDCFPSRMTRERYAHRLRQACDAGANYVRVWGGGIYESEDFYDAADELGLLVGQDFLFACAAYPEEPPLREEVAAEAEEHVARLASHPSLVTWTGNNECVWGYHDWDWQERLGDRSWGASYYLDLLPSIVAELDPTRPYWPGSPYSGSPDRHPNDPRYGSTHQWNVWAKTPDYLRYRESVPRFVAEFGFQGPPTWPTMEHGYHQKAREGDAKIDAALAAHFPAPRDDDDWHYLAQLNQARAVSLGVEHYRSHRGVCMGTVVWQLNDCWPVASWAAVDGEGRYKPLWYALRHSYQPRLLTIQPRDGSVAVVAVNDDTMPWAGTVMVRRVGFDGLELAAAALNLAVPAGDAVTLPIPPSVATPGDPRAELLVADCSARAWWFFVPDREAAYPPADYEAAVTRTADGTQVTVTARTLLRDVTLFPDRLDPGSTVDTALITLLPGESATFAVRTQLALDAVALTAAPVLRCVNDHPAYGQR